MENMIGQRIKERRKELKITQTQIQQETSISSGNLSCIENGKYLPSAIALLELSKILDCSVDWLLTGNSSISDNSIFLDTEEKELLNGFRELPEDDREELLCLMQMKLRKVKKEKDMTAKSSGLTGTEKGNMVG
uniref:helix-turn-helix domain-containing protein n=1 Tax=Agathobacter sp. TaxID=2021311 RepID=UPI0040564467